MLVEPAPADGRLVKLLVVVGHQAVGDPLLLRRLVEFRYLRQHARREERENVTRLLLPAGLALEQDRLELVEDDHGPGEHRERIEDQLGALLYPLLAGARDVARRDLHERQPAAPRERFEERRLASAGRPEEDRGKSLRVLVRQRRAEHVGAHLLEGYCYRP